MKTAKTVHDQKLDRWGDRTPEHSTNPLPYSSSLARKKKFVKSQEKREAGVRLGDPALKGGEETYQYMELCKGRELRPAAVTSKLYCLYSKGHHAMYTIGPLRVEIVSLRPYITVTHGLLLAGEPEALISRAADHLRRSEMVGKQVNGTGLTDDRRVSEQTWLNETDSPVLDKLTNRISMFLNLNATSSSRSTCIEVFSSLSDSKYLQELNFYKKSHILNHVLGN